MLQSHMSHVQVMSVPDATNCLVKILFGNEYLSRWGIIHTHWLCRGVITRRRCLFCAASPAELILSLSDQHESVHKRLDALHRCIHPVRIFLGQYLHTSEDKSFCHLA